MTIRRLAISGASGLIGSSLIPRLVSGRLGEPPNSRVHSSLQPPLELFLLKRSVGSAARMPTRRDSKTPAANGSFPSIDWQPEHGVSIPRELEGMDAIVHLAGRSIDAARWTRAEQIRLRDSRVRATERLVDQIVKLESKPKLFLGASAVGIYGDCGDEWVSESRRASPDFLGQLASDWESAAKPLEVHGTRLVHVRLGVVLTSRGGALKKILPLFRTGLGGRLGSGKQFMSWIGLDDCIRALIFLIQNERAKGPINLVSPLPVTNQAFTQAIGRAIHRPTLFPAPKWALRLALGKMADPLLLSSCRATPSKLLDLGFEFQYPELLGFMQHELG